MLTKNVFYSERPERVIVNRIGNTGTCRVDLPVNIQEVEAPEGETQYKADVYSTIAGYTPNIAQRIEANYDAWLAKAQNEPEPPEAPSLLELQQTNAMLTECILEMSEIIYG